MSKHTDRPWMRPDRRRRLSPVSRRLMVAEQLEDRRLLSTSPWRHNVQLPPDVNADGNVSPLDAVLVIKQLTAQQAGTTAAFASSDDPSAAPLYVDVNNDQAVSPLDAILVINRLNQEAQQNGEELIRVRLELVHPDCTSFTTLFADEPAAFTIGIAELVLLRGYVQDLRDVPEGGVRSAYFDLSWDTGLLEPVGELEFGEHFPNGASGEVVAEGIDELGAADSQTPTGGEESLLFALPLRTNGTGTVTFTMNPADDLGHDFQLYDIVGTIDPGEVQFVSTEVTIVNGLRPTALNDSYRTTTGQTLDVPLSAGVLINDADPEEEALTAIRVAGPNNGELVLNNDGTFTYAPQTGFIGTDSFTYAASDGLLITCPATVTIDVTQENQAPVAAPDEYELIEDERLVVSDVAGVLANDVDPDEDPVVAVVVTEPQHGTLDLQSDGSFTYTPESNFNGTDSFSYAASDGDLQSAPVEVTLLVSAVNDPPIAQPDEYSVATDQILQVSAAEGVLANDTDPDDAVLIAQVVDAPAHGVLELSESGAFTYTPDVGFAGEDTFTYVASDGGLVSETQTVVIQVTAAALADFILVPVTLTGQPLPAITPGAEFLLQVFVQDIGTPPQDGVFSAYMDLQYDPSLLSVNGPIAYGGSYPNAQDGVVDEESGLIDEFGAVGTGVVLGADPVLLATIPFLAVEAGVAEITTNPADQQPLHQVVLINESEEVPPAQVRYGTATVTILEGERPTAEPDTYTTAEDTVLTVPVDEGVLINDSDPDGDPLVAQRVSDAQHGTVQLQSDGSFVYTPNANFFGTDTFTYVASDTVSQSAPATVTIHVTPVDDPPLAVGDSYEQPDINQPLVISAQQGVLANDSDPDGDALTAQLVEPAEFGAVELNSDGSFTYSPPENFIGIDRFQYVALSGDLQSEPATVTIEVGNINEPASISGIVYIDANDNGIPDEGELRLGNVEVRLEGTDAAQNEVALSATTDQNGSYTFAGMTRGQYTIGQVQPLHLIDGLDDVDGDLTYRGDVIDLDLLPGVDLEINFGERGLEPRHVGNSFFFSSRRPGGMLAALDADGEQRWFALDDGWEAFTSVDVTFDASTSTVRLSAVRTGGEVVSIDLALANHPQMCVTGAPDDGYVVRIDGPSSDYGLQSAGTAVLSTAAVDAAFRDS